MALEGPYINQAEGIAIAQNVFNSNLPGINTSINSQIVANNLLAWTYSQSYALTTITRNSDEAITSAIVVWPDGASGIFTTDTLSSVFVGAIDAYHVTYIPETGPTKTVTQPLLIRNDSGSVINQPDLILT